MEKTGVTARAEEAPWTVSPWLTAVLAAAMAGGAVWLIRLGTPAAVSGGVLLAIVALGAAAVLLGGEPYGAESEGRFGLSVRLGLGLLGGTLGALVSAAAEWVAGGMGLTAALGVEITGRFSAGALGLHVLSGALWGLIAGVVLPAMPGRRTLARGTALGLVPALWMLLKVFPVDRELGLFGAELGVLTFLFVLFFWFLWGVTTTSVVAWGVRTDVAPLDRPLGS